VEGARALLRTTAFKAQRRLELVMAPRAHWRNTGNPSACPLFPWLSRADEWCAMPDPPQEAFQQEMSAVVFLKHEECRDDWQVSLGHAANEALVDVQVTAQPLIDGRRAVRLFGSLQQIRSARKWILLKCFGPRE